MIMVLRKLVPNHKDRMIYASLVIIAANSGGAFSPIGDVTTIMLWNKGVITAAGVMKEIFYSFFGVNYYPYTSTSTFFERRTRPRRF